MQHQDKKLLLKFGKHIKELRIERSNSLNSFAFKNGGTTSATLSRIENGLVDLKFTTLVKISKALNIPLKDLFCNFDYEYDINE